MHSPSFLQSAAWEQFQQAAGKKTVRVGETLLIEQTTPVGPYWYAPRPVVDPATTQALLDHGHATGALFVRVDPETMSGELPVQARQTEATQPQDSLVLDLKPADELLQTFHEKTRYNIRLAEKKGVTITESSAADSKELAAFIQLSQGTSQRQAFHYHSDDYYRVMLETMGTSSDERISVSVLAAWQDTTPLAALIAVWTPTVGYYLHGASSYEHRSLMAPHLLQFRTMARALELGCTKYDFWGIAPEGAPDSHPWAGVTRFKLGFGGNRVHYPDSFDVVTHAVRYNIYTIARRLRRSM